MSWNVASAILIAAALLFRKGAERAWASEVRGQETTARDGSVLVPVPAGEFEMGDGDGLSNNPKHTVFLDAFFIGKYCVTNGQYANFVKAAGHRPPANSFWNTPEFAAHPATDVSWDDARAYAKWAGCDLPTEAQWEKAARGPNGCVYPWGDEWDASKCRNASERGNESTAPVDAYPQGASGYGTHQQSGNVWEWCRDWYGEKYYENAEAASNPEGPSRGAHRARRGGCWQNDHESNFRAAYRGSSNPSHRSGNRGFRIARRP